MTSYACLASELLALRRRQKVCGWQARKFLFPSEFNSVAKTRNWVNLVSHKMHLYYWTWRLGKNKAKTNNSMHNFLRILVLHVFTRLWKKGHTLWARISDTLTLNFLINEQTRIDEYGGKIRHSRSIFNVKNHICSILKTLFSKANSTRKLFHLQNNCQNLTQCVELKLKFS